MPAAGASSARARSASASRSTPAGSAPGSSDSRGDGGCGGDKGSDTAAIQVVDGGGLDRSSCREGDEEQLDLGI